MQMDGSYVLQCGPACSSVFYSVDIVDQVFILFFISYSMGSVDQAVLISSTTWAVWTRLFSVSYSMDSVDQAVLLVYSMGSVDQVVLYLLQHW